MRPRLLDLFCGAGGCSVGYERAGFDVVGVDVAPQPNYRGGTFVQADALEFVREHGREHGREFDAIHASPPCQGFSKTRRILEGKGLRNHKAANYLADLRAAFRRWPRTPYVIENVPGAPLINPLLLCGTMFGLQVYRHRLFETNAPIVVNGLIHARHAWRTGSHRGYSRGPFITVGGHNFKREDGARAMGIDWMRTRPELAEAIPPAYTEWLGRRLLEEIGRTRALAEMTA